jgi:CRP/FNR family transcriptional regulator, cyclic AMP receptor protein
VVLAGSVKVFQTSEDGKDQVLNTLGAGESFGELAMIEGRPRTATVQTLQDAELLVLSRQDFETFAEQHPKLLWKLLQALSERVRQYMESALDLAFRDAPYRLLRVLHQLLQRHGVAEAEGRRIGLALTIGELASMVGATPDTVGRLLDGFEKDGLIRRAGESWVVPDPRALDRALEYAAQ